jgi:hypothetical protein
MLRPFRLLMLAVLALLVYWGFFMIPHDDRDETAFDPVVLGEQETDVWRAAQAHDEFAVFPSVVLMLREQHRFSWFRAAQASYYLSRATIRFVDMRTSFQRVLPDLQAAAEVEQAWKQADFSPIDAAGAQMNWWALTKNPNQRGSDLISSLIADDFAIRYETQPGDMLASARYRAEAIRMRDTNTDPDWQAIRQQLVESYRALQAALVQNHRRRAAAKP